MHKLFNPDNDFFRLLAKLADILVFSLLFVISLLLILPGGAGRLALYDASYRSLRENHLRGVARFISSWRANLWSCMLSGLINLAVELGLYFSYNALVFRANAQGQLSSLFFSFCFLAVLLLGCLSWIHPLRSRFEFSTGAAYITALQLSFARPLRTLAAGLLRVGALLLLDQSLFAIWPLFLLPALVAWLLSYLFEPVFEEYM